MIELKKSIYQYEDVAIDSFVGKVFKKVLLSEDKERLDFMIDDNHAYCMFHEQDCCESVSLNDVDGELNYLEEAPILEAYVSTNSKEPVPDEEWSESFTWTYYKFRTTKGWVSLRWLGESNGYYSEAVSIVEVKSDI